MTTEHDYFFMKRAFSVASVGIGNTSPFPMIGYVVAQNDAVLAEGWYTKVQQMRFLKNIFANVPNKNLLRNSTLYLTSYPFLASNADFELIRKHKVFRLVIACSTDSKHNSAFYKQNSKKFNISLGNEVWLQEEKALNSRYYFALRHHIPYVILKWAETADGYIARENFDAKWISNDLSRKLVHKWRSEEDGILVGTNTAHHDNPLLNVRHWAGRNPFRIVIDRNLRLDKNLCLFDGTQPTLCYNLIQNKKEDNLEYVSLADSVNNNTSFFHALLSDLYNRNIHSLIVEGGTTILEHFIAENLWNEARVFKSPQKFGKGIASPVLRNATLDAIKPIADDILFYYKGIS